MLLLCKQRRHAELIKIINSILMILNNCIIQWFSFHVTIWSLKLCLVFFHSSIYFWWHSQFFTTICLKRNIKFFYQIFWCESFQTLPAWLYTSDNVDCRGNSICIKHKIWHLKPSHEKIIKREEYLNLVPTKKDINNFLTWAV